MNLFLADTRRAIDNMTSDLDSATVENYVQLAKQHKGEGLFTFVMEQAEKFGMTRFQTQTPMTDVSKAHFSTMPVHKWLHGQELLVGHVCFLR